MNNNVAMGNRRRRIETRLFQSTQHSFTDNAGDLLGWLFESIGLVDRK